jgi:hypothetical protein
VCIYIDTCTCTDIHTHTGSLVHCFLYQSQTWRIHICIYIYTDTYICWQSRALFSSSITDMTCTYMYVYIHTYTYKLTISCVFFFINHRYDKYIYTHTYIYRLAVSCIVFFINHRYDGIPLWDLRLVPGVHALCWALSFVSFWFLYPWVSCLYKHKYIHIYVYMLLHPITVLGTFFYIQNISVPVSVMFMCKYVCIHHMCVYMSLHPYTVFETLFFFSPGYCTCKVCIHTYIYIYIYTHTHIHALNKKRVWHYLLLSPGYCTHKLSYTNTHAYIHTHNIMCVTLSFYFLLVIVPIGLHTHTHTHTHLHICVWHTCLMFFRSTFNLLEVAAVDKPKVCVCVFVYCAKS